MTWDQLLDAAERAHANAYAPYSRFAVGSAVEAADGTIFAGCNLENRSYGLTLCAERVAIAAANAAGHRDLRRIVVLTDTEVPARPCGLCLDTMAELGHDLAILLASTGGAQEQFRLSDLLPQPFQFEVPPGPPFEPSP